MIIPQIIIGFTVLIVLCAVSMPFGYLYNRYILKTNNIVELILHTIMLMFLITLVIMLCYFLGEATIRIYK